MKSNLKLILTAAVLFSLSFFFSSCSDDDDEMPAGAFETGVFVVNEGNFNSADGSITHIAPNGIEASQSIFNTTNDGAILGDVVQSMAIHNELAYIVVNNSNKVEVVNANTFEREYTLDALLPRYFTVLNGKGYLTEWVSFGEKGRVSVLNLESRMIESTIETDFGAEFILAVRGSLYVSNSFTNTISVINPTSNSVIATIELSGSVTQLVVDENEKIWAISAGTTDFSVDPPLANNDGKLIRLDPDTNTVEAELQLNANVSSRLAINASGNTLYILRGTSVFAIPTNGFSGTLEPLITQSDAIGFYGIGIEPGSDYIYVGDARGFQGNGQVYRYFSDGTLIDSFNSGRGPNGFVFK